MTNREFLTAIASMENISEELKAEAKAAPAQNSEESPVQEKAGDPV